MILHDDSIEREFKGYPVVFLIQAQRRVTLTVGV